MGQMMEALFCVAYLVVTVVLGILICKDKEKLFGILTLVLVGGDAFHLVPRIIGAVRGIENTAALGFGTLVTSITMTVFYVLLAHFMKPKKYVLYGVYALAVVRFVLCAFPQNDWLTGGNLYWGIMRNIPFIILGAVIVVLLYQHLRTNQYFKFAWLAVTLSFAFYIPVVLFADAFPITGMFMLPKTVCYVWLIVMGYRYSKSE